MTYYHVRITLNKGDSEIEVMLDLEFDEVQSRFLVPYQQGVPITVNGRTFDPSEIERIEVAKSSEKSAILIDRIRRRRANSRSLFFRPAEWEIIEEGEDITNQLITGPPGQDSHTDSRDVEDLRPPTDTKKVFVVHGRNERAREAIFTFLRSIGLDPLEWSRAVMATQKTAPYVGEVLDAAFKQANAIVVLLTPDDEARLLEAFRMPDDPTHETELTGQARPNVLFEAGMAMGRSEERTILVELGNLRPFSDIAGRHVIRLNNSPEQRQELANRLEAAGCPVNTKGKDWIRVGDFDAAVSSEVLGQLGTATDATQQSALADSPQLSNEARELLASACNDYARTILVSKSHDGDGIRTNYRDFGERGDTRSQAMWEQALRELVEFGLVEDEDGNGTTYKVTHKGFELADSSGVSK